MITVSVRRVMTGRVPGERTSEEAAVADMTAGCRSGNGMGKGGRPRRAARSRHQGWIRPSLVSRSSSKVAMLFIVVFASCEPVIALLYSSWALTSSS